MVSTMSPRSNRARFRFLVSMVNWNLVLPLPDERLSRRRANVEVVSNPAWVAQLYPLRHSDVATAAGWVWVHLPGGNLLRAKIDSLNSRNLYLRDGLPW